MLQNSVKCAPLCCKEAPHVFSLTSLLSGYRTLTQLDMMHITTSSLETVVLSQPVRAIDTENLQGMKLTQFHRKVLHKTEPEFHKLKIF